MTDKHTVNFGDICREVKLTSKDPIADGYEYYIGLEHLDSGALNIKRRGVLSEDNPSFNRVFRKGDILLGKRRPYLRKAAIANFSGVCSNDIVVLSANKNIIKEPLVQYVIHSDAFWQWAVKTSAGGLSPRTKFKDLEKFSFIIPNRLSQEKYCNLFECNSNVVEALESSLSALYTTRKVFLEEKVDIGKWAALFKVSNRNKYPLVKLDDIADRGSGHTPSKSFPNYWNGGIKWVSLQDSRSLDNIYLNDTAQNISELGVQNSSATVHPKGTVVVCRDASIGMAAILDDDMAVSQHFIIRMSLAN
jgi:type I restriction enzyme S subunit